MLCGFSAPLCLPSLSRLAPVTSPDLLARTLALKDASVLSGVLRRGPNPSQHSWSNLLAKYAPRFLEAGRQGWGRCTWVGGGGGGKEHGPGLWTGTHVTAKETTVTLTCRRSE